MSRDYSKSEFSKHRAALREFESVCDRVEDLEQENNFLYSDREHVAQERDAAVHQVNETVEQIRDLNSRVRYFGRYSNVYKSQEEAPKKQYSDIFSKGLFGIIVVAVVLLACGITPDLGDKVDLWIEFICDPWKLMLSAIVLLGTYKLMFKKQ